MKRTRARRIVRKAAEMPGNSSASEWLWRDEYGTWEEMAGELWDKSAERRIDLDLPDEEAETLVAVELRLRALTSLVHHQEKL